MVKIRVIKYLRSVREVVDVFPEGSCLHSRAKQKKCTAKEPQTMAHQGVLRWTSAFRSLHHEMRGRRGDQKAAGPSWASEGGGEGVFNKDWLAWGSEGRGRNTRISKQSVYLADYFEVWGTESKSKNNLSSKLLVQIRSVVAKGGLWPLDPFRPDYRFFAVMPSMAFAKALRIPPTHSASNAHSQRGRGIFRIQSVYLVEVHYQPL